MNKFRYCTVITCDYVLVSDAKTPMEHIFAQIYRDLLCDDNTEEADRFLRAHPGIDGVTTLQYNGFSSVEEQTEFCRERNLMPV